MSVCFLVTEFSQSGDITGRKK